MALLPIVEVPDPRLRQISSRVDKVDDDIRALVADMFETMYAAPGIGLAAIQSGVPKRILVIDLQEPEEEDGEPVKDPRVFINPQIVEHSDQDVPYTEGCLSVPDQYAEVDRPDRIRARWLDLDHADAGRQVARRANDAFAPIDRFGHRPIPRPARARLSPLPAPAFDRSCAAPIRPLRRY